MDLVPYMYWERQEAGSQLCAQHCLNNLLQQYTYSEFDLAEIARRLDAAENATLSTPNKKSYNYDDSGYFSISVLERALEVWDLTLVRWRGEAMKPFQEKPEEQVAFILNLSSHWIPLRRFGASLNTPTSTKRWYSLNSFLRNPDWISPTYLRMVLTQAEQEGYSVFVVRKASKPESQQPDPSEAAKEAEQTQEGGDAEKVKGRRRKGKSNEPDPGEYEGQGWGDGGVAVLPECQADIFALSLGEPHGRSGGSLVTVTTGGVASGSSRVPLASSNPDQPTVDPASITPPSGPSAPPSPPQRRKKRQEDPTDPSAPVDIPSTSHQAIAGDDEDIPSEEGIRDVWQTGEGEGDEPMDFAYHSRSYDDEDEALQRALKASMEDAPADWQPPKLETQRAAKPTAIKPSVAQAVQPHLPPTTSTAEEKADAKSPTTSKFKEELEEDDDDAVAEELSADEIRKRRLARFGA